MNATDLKPTRFWEEYILTELDVDRGNVDGDALTRLAGVLDTAAVRTLEENNE